MMENHPKRRSPITPIPLWITSAESSDEAPELPLENVAAPELAPEVPEEIGEPQLQPAPTVVEPRERNSFSRSAPTAAESISS